jgi:hypothetical protein
MKKIILTLISLIALLSIAEAQVHNQDAGAQVGGTQVLGHTTDGNDTLNTAGKWGKFAVSTTGSQFVTSLDPASGLSQAVIPGSGSVGLNGALNVPQGTFLVGTDTIEAASTTTVLNLAAHAARIGDWITPTAGTAGNIDVAIPVCATTANTVTLCYPLPATPSTDAIKITRNAPLNTPKASQLQVTGDTGVPVMVVRNENYASLGSANTGFVPMAAYRSGAIMVNLDYSGLGASDIGVPYTPEDTAIANLKAVMLAGGVAKSSVAQTVSTTEDAAPIALDMANRQITIAAPSGQMVQGCNTAVVTATTGQVIAAVASQFTFITSLSCTNTGAAATRVILEDGDGTDLANVMLAATTGFAHVSFPTPVRTNVVNKAIQINVITTSSSTICCASGYTGVI